jgi:Holliday junction resolvasome RuvABC ATP-dependent DNA helicase subunit
MKDKISQTSNIRNCVSKVEDLKNRPKRSDCLGLFYGRWGLGKSTLIEFIYTNIRCFYVRAMEAWLRSTNMMIEDILRAYHVEPKGRIKSDLPELVRAIKKHGHPLFIDEADRVVRKLTLIEIIRDIHDLAKTPIILVGGEHIINLLQRRDLGPVFSRITSIYEFKELTTQDIQHVSMELCGLECNSKVANYVRTVTLGDFRLLNALLIRAEGLCSLNKKTEITPAIAKEASTAMPHPDDLRRVAESEDLIVSDNANRMAAAG